MAGVVLAVVVVAALSACSALGGGSRGPTTPVQSEPAGAGSSPRTPVPFQGSGGTFHIRDVDGNTFDLVYGYEPSRAKTRPLAMPGIYAAEVEVEATYRLQIVNTTPERALSFKPDSDWPATFGLFAFWESPNPICDRNLGPGRKGWWCAIELAHFHIDHDVPVGTSVELTAHPGFSDSYPVDAGTLALKPSDVLAVRDALARPDDVVVDYEGNDGWRFVDSCPLEGFHRSPQPPGSRPTGDPRLPIAARSGTCRAFQNMSIFPTDANYLNPSEQYTYLD